MGASLRMAADNARPEYDGGMSERLDGRELGLHIGEAGVPG